MKLLIIPLAILSATPALAHPSAMSQHFHLELGVILAATLVAVLSGVFAISRRR